MKGVESLYISTVRGKEMTYALYTARARAFALQEECTVAYGAREEAAYEHQSVPSEHHKDEVSRRPSKCACKQS